MFKKSLFLSFMFVLIWLVFLTVRVEAQRVVIAQQIDADSLDPNFHGSVPAVNVFKNIFDTLLIRDKDGKLAKQLATSYELVNPTTWRFEMRKGISFHNGEPLNAECVKFAFDQIFAPGSVSRAKPWLSTIDRIEVVNENTVNIITKAPDPILPARLVFLHMVPPKYYKEMGHDKFSQKPIGTGAYKFVEWMTGDHILLERNDKWWGGTVPIKEVLYRCMPETQSRIAALQTGEADFASAIPPDLAKRTQTKGRFEFKSTLTNRILYLILDTIHESPITNLKVRQAINYAIDREMIIKHILEGYGESRATLVPKGIFAHNTSIKPYPYDPKKARQLLADAGYSDGFSIEMNAPAGRYMRDKEVCQAIAGQLNEVGIKVDLKIIEFGTYVSLITAHKAAPIYLLGWNSLITDPDQFLWNNLHSGTPFSQTADKELDAMLEKGRRDMDPKSREKLYWQAQKRLYDQAYLGVLYQQKSLWGVSKRVEWSPRADENILIRDMKLKK